MRVSAVVAWRAVVLLGARSLAIGDGVEPRGADATCTTLRPSAQPGYEECAGWRCRRYGARRIGGAIGPTFQVRLCIREPSSLECSAVETRADLAAMRTTRVRSTRHGPGIGGARAHGGRAVRPAAIRAALATGPSFPLELGSTACAWDASIPTRVKPCSADGCGEWSGPRSTVSVERRCAAEWTHGGMHCRVVWWARRQVLCRQSIRAARIRAGLAARCRARPSIRAARIPRSGHILARDGVRIAPSHLMLSVLRRGSSAVAS